MLREGFMTKMLVYDVIKEFCHHSDVLLANTMMGRSL